MSVQALQLSQATGQLQKQELELKQRQVADLGKSGTSLLSDAEKAKKLREACEGFESIFIQRMWQQMRATVPKENPLVGREEQFWQGMYDQELSKKMSSGGGIGLADMMYDQLSGNIVSASRTTAATLGNSQRQTFEVSPAPLMANYVGQGNTTATLANDTAPTNTKPVANNIYNNIYEDVPSSTNARTQNYNTAATATSPFVQPNGMLDGQGVDRARQAQHVAANQPPAQGVLPPLNGMSHTQAGTQGDSLSPNTAPLTTGEALLQAQMSEHFVLPTHNNAPANMQNTPYATAPMNGIAPNATNTNPNPTIQNLGEPTTVKTTYTTNIPQNRRTQRRGQRKLEGQAHLHNAQAQAQMTAQGTYPNTSTGINTNPAASTQSQLALGPYARQMGTPVPSTTIQNNNS